MCPKRQIISLYCDGEIPSPWDEKMKAHLDSCPECRAVVAEYDRVGEYLGSGQKETIMAAQKRVWEKLTAPELVKTGIETREIVSKGHNRNWRRITLPLPVAAAALLVMMSSFALLGISTFNRPVMQDHMATANIAVEDQGIVPVNDVSGTIEYLSSQGLGDFVVIQLPAGSPNFSRSGEPVLINAAHYSRRNTFR